MIFSIDHTEEALKQLRHLKSDPSLKKRFKAVTKALALMSVDIRHPSLNTHEYTKLSNLLGVKVFEAYAENNTPKAYRIFWRYSDKNCLLYTSDAADES